jgi:hypothetical protein
MIRGIFFAVNMDKVSRHGTLSGTAVGRHRGTSLGLDAKAAPTQKRTFNDTMATKTIRKAVKKTGATLSKRVLEDAMRNLRALDKEIDKLISKRTSSH